MAVEADWPDAYRVNRYVRGRGDDADAEEALRGFKRFPQWMWRNADVLDFVGWLRAHNDGRRRHDGQGRLLRPRPLQPARLDRGGARLPAIVDPAAARARAQRYACFDHFGDDPQAYGYAAALRPGAVLRARGRRAARRAAALAPPNTRGATAGSADDDLFFAEQNARLVRERRASTTARCSAAASRRGTCATGTWPRRSTRWSTISTTPATAAPKVVVWAHNSHLGDARATEMGGTRRARTSASSCASGTGRCACSSASPRTRHGHGGLRLGRAGRAQAGAAGAAGQLRGAVPRGRRQDVPALDLRRPHAAAERSREPGWSGRSASSTGPRPSGRATTSAPACRTSSTPCSTIDPTRAVEPLRADRALGGG